MLDHLTLCTGCKKMYYFGDSTYLTCNACNSREKPTKKEVVMCGSEGCKFQRSVENKYCGKHQICLFVDEVVANGKRVCVNYVRGCRAQLDQTYAFTRCEECLEKDREKDRKRRGASIAAVAVPVPAPVAAPVTVDVDVHAPVAAVATVAAPVAVAEPENVFVKICTTCTKTKDIREYIGERGDTTKRCAECREKGKIADKRRDKEKRNEKARIAEATPERKQIKKEWSVNVRYKSVPYHYSSYVRHAEERSLCFDIDIDMYTSIVAEKCYYCDGMNDVGFNGVDRKDNKIGYTVDNSVACCSICNFMKKTTPAVEFIRKSIHLFHYASEKKQVYPELFADHTGVHYCVYNKRSIERYQTDIPRDMYDRIVAHACYLCGKTPSKTHKNGIDRFDNDIGYTDANCRPCCGDCNMMKRDYSYELLMEKMEQIRNKHE